MMPDTPGVPGMPPAPHNDRRRRIATVRALVTFYGLTRDEVNTAFLEVEQRATEGMRPCPACPDGYAWSATGQTDKPCPVCLGKAWVPVGKT